MARSAKAKIRLVQSVDRALRMVEMLASEPKGLTLSQLSDRLGLLRQTAQGLLRTLQTHEMVYQSGRGEPYMLGPCIHRLARRWTTSQDLAVLARKACSDLSRRIGEYVLLAELRGRTVFSMVEVCSDQPLTVGHECESFACPHAMATGQLLMAFLAPEQQKAVLAKLSLNKVAPRTITSRQQLLKRLMKIRRQGYVVNIEEGTLGLGTLAVPVRDTNGEVTVALGVCVPLARFSRNRRRILRRRLLETAEQIQGLWSST